MVATKKRLLFCCFFPTLFEAALADILISCSLPGLQVCCCKLSPLPKRERFQVLAQQQYPRRALQVYFLWTPTDMTTKFFRKASKVHNVALVTVDRQSKYISWLISKDTLTEGCSIYAQMRCCSCTTPHVSSVCMGNRCPQCSCGYH